MTTANQMTLIKSEKYYGVAGGAMGTISRKYVAGVMNKYKKDSFIIFEFIPRNDLKQDQTKKYIVKGFSNDDSIDFYNSINWNDVYNKVNEIKNEELNIINTTDITKAIKFMYDNKNAMVKFMDSYKIEKSLAFLNMIKDFYSEYYMTIFTIEVIAKIMIKYGYNFKSLKEIRELYHK